MCYEPTDENKASKPFLSDSWKALTYISPNLQELRAINRTLGNPLPAGIEYSEGSVRLLDNLDPGEGHFLLQFHNTSKLVYNTVGIPKCSWCLAPYSHLCVGCMDWWPIRDHNRPGRAPCPNPEIPFASLHHLNRSNIWFVSMSLKHDARRAPVPAVPPCAEMKHSTKCRWKSDSIKTRKPFFKIEFWSLQTYA